MLTQDMIDEMNLLLHYKLDTTLEGIKIHKDADPSVIAAAQRLHGKGLVTETDGGYLTDLGRTAAEHVHACKMILHP